MKKKKRNAWIVAVVVVVLAVTAVGIGYGVRAYQKNMMLMQQNYVASRLIEQGEYEQGRMLAAQSEQMRENEISEELLVLVAGFQSDYEVGILYTDKYLEKQNDAIMESAREIYEKTLENLKQYPKEDSYQYMEYYHEQADAVRKELLPLLVRVQNNISIKKGSENMLAMVNVMSGSGSTADLAVLEGDDSLLARKVRVSYAVDNGNYVQAYEEAEQLYKDNGTFENRAVLANIVAEQGASVLEIEEADRLSERLVELSEEVSGLETKRAQEGNASRQQEISEEIAVVRNRIEETRQEMDAIPAERAINFFEASTPVSERGTAAYQIELAQLCFLAGEKEQARQLLTSLIKSEDELNEDPAGFMLLDLMKQYSDSEGSSYQLMDAGTELDMLWNRIAKLLGFIEKNRYGQGSFYSFVMELLNQLYNGVIIRSVDATDFPTVRVTVNVSMELEHALEKKNFGLVELGEPLEDFRLLDLEELEEDEEMSVVLVVDRSGSMSGAPMEDTKKATTNFVRTIDENIEVGLVVFDTSAQVIAPVAKNRNGVLQGIAGVDIGGGTSIYSGLQTAGDELTGKSGKKIIILLSDGADGSGYMIDTVLDDLKLKNIYVYTIGFGGADTECLSYIAKKCDGKFIQADSSSVLSEIYSTIGEYMVNDYVIEFTVTQDPLEFTRIVEVSVDVNDAFSERTYHVGVPLDKIEAEQYEKPLADYFRQVGGSWMGEE